jgi:hypothetical protein
MGEFERGAAALRFSRTPEQKQQPLTHASGRRSVEL